MTHAPFSSRKNIMVPPYDFYPKMTFIYIHNARGSTITQNFSALRVMVKLDITQNLRIVDVGQKKVAKLKNWRPIMQKIWKTMTHQIELSGPLVNVWMCLYKILCPYSKHKVLFSVNTFSSYHPKMHTFL